MDQRDRRLLPFAISALFALLAMVVVGVLVAWPGGGFDMSGMWTILIVGGLVWIGVGVVLSFLLRQR